MNVEFGYFVWDFEKEKVNISKHGVNFIQASHAFADSKRLILVDEKHLKSELRYFCIGFDGNGILTVRFTMRGNLIRIFGASYWRDGKKIYEEKNKIHK